ncbi:MAG: signal peptidase II [Selenomonadaceae bacterium]|nr:signal peptidase II [Selenomonadaceae bacterium]MBP3722498.1 signal peptidase II [Selenomonadaceae bacterium]
MYYYLFIGIILFDQIVKRIVALNMKAGETIPIIQNAFHITYILNPGAAFGILENERVFFIIAGFLVLALGVYLLPKLKKQEKLIRFGSIFLLAGAVGNLIDRIRNGLVIDFIDFRVWPVFNIADIAICSGTFFIIYSVIKSKEDRING